MHNSKTCFKCNTNKPLCDFYKHKQMADGHLNKCKECNKNDVKENTKKNKDYYVEYDRQRDQLPNRILLKKRYSQTDAGKESLRKSKEKYISTNIVKRAAHIILGNAIRGGKITKSSSCSQCNANDVRIQGHHDDYAYPLSVRWLCSKCHTKWHKENGPGMNG